MGKEGKSLPVSVSWRDQSESESSNNISLFLLQAMGLVREISLRLRKGTTEVVVYGEVWPLATGHRPPPPPTAKPKRNKAANSEE